MATVTAGFEVAGATNGQTINTTDAGDATAWDVASSGASATRTYDTGVVYAGTKSAKFTTGATSTTTACRWNSAGAWASISDHYGRAYIQITSAWITTWEIMRFLNASALAAAISIDSTQHILVKDSAGTTQATAATALPTGAWVRIEWHIVHSATVGSIVVQVFVGANIEGTVPDYTISATNINTGTAADEARFGLTTANVNSGPIYFDAIVAHATAAVGGLGTPPATDSGTATATGTPSAVEKITDSGAVQATGTPSGVGSTTTLSTDSGNVVTTVTPSGVGSVRVATPQNLVLPFIYGTPSVGSTLTVDDGVWV